MSQGQATFTMELRGYRPVPRNIQEEIIEERRKMKEALAKRLTRIEGATSYTKPRRRNSIPPLFCRQVRRFAFMIIHFLTKKFGQARRIRHEFLRATQVQSVQAVCFAGTAVEHDQAELMLHLVLALNARLPRRPNGVRLRCQVDGRGSTGSSGFPRSRKRSSSLLPSTIELGEPTEGQWLAHHREPGQTFAQYLRIRPNVLTRERNKLYVQPIGTFFKKAGAVDPAECRVSFDSITTVRSRVL